MSKHSVFVVSALLTVACNPAPQELRGPEGTVFVNTATGEAINVISDGNRGLTVSPENAASLRQYIGVVEDHIQQHWLPPTSATTEPECMIRIRVTPSGEVTEAIVRAENCFGDSIVQSAIIDSVVRSSPLPRPPEFWSIGHVLELMVRAGPRLELLVPDRERTNYRCDRDTGFCG